MKIIDGVEYIAIVIVVSLALGIFTVFQCRIRRVTHHSPVLRFEVLE